MTYVVTKMIKGHPYKYLVKSVREGDKVRQVFIRYLGRAGEGEGADYEPESVEREIVERPVATAPITPTVPIEKETPAPAEPKPEVVAPKPTPTPVTAEVPYFNPQGMRALKEVASSKGDVLQENSADLIAFLEEYTQLASLGKEYSDKKINDLYTQIKLTDRDLWNNATKSLVEEAEKTQSRLDKVIAIDAFANLIHSRGSQIPYLLVKPSDLLDPNDVFLLSQRTQEILTNIKEGKITRLRTRVTPEVVAPESTPTPVTKEAWQMTKAERATYIEQKGKEAIQKWNESGGKGFPPSNPERWGVSEVNKAADELGMPWGEVRVAIPQHKYEVMVALKQGKSIPPEVLKDYPELKPTTPKEVKPESLQWDETHGEIPDDIKSSLSNIIESTPSQYRNLIKGFRLNPLVRGANASYRGKGMIQFSSIRQAKNVEAPTIYHEIGHAVLEDSINTNRQAINDFAESKGITIDWDDLEKRASQYTNRPNTVVEAFNINYEKLGEQFAGSISTDIQNTINPELEVTPEETRPYPMTPQERRRAILESRIKRGEPVPDKLLAEFPDLKAEAAKPETPKVNDFDLVERIWEAKNFSTKELAEQYNMPVNKMYKILSDLEDKGILYGWHFSGESRGKTGENLKSLEWTVNTDKQSDVGGTVGELKDFYEKKTTQPEPSVSVKPEPTPKETVNIGDFVRLTVRQPDGKLKSRWAKLESRGKDTSIYIPVNNEGDDLSRETKEGYEIPKELISHSLITKEETAYIDKTYGTLKTEPTINTEIMARPPRTDQIGSTMKPVVEEVSDIGGFEQTLSPANRAKALTQMNEKKMISGKVQSRKEYVEDAVSKGATVGIKEGKPALVFPDGRYIRQSEITKTALDYATYLKDKPTETPKPDTNIKPLLSHLRTAPQSKSTESYLRKTFGDEVVDQAHQDRLVTRTPKGIYTITVSGRETIKDIPEGKVNLYAEGKRILSESITMQPETTTEKESLIARHTETRISPETGLDTEYSTEYRVIEAPENAGAEWMGNPYGVIRIFTKGGVEVDRDLLEIGMSPEAVIKALPYETSYKKAEKFGLAKSEYEKYEKGLADKEQAKEAKEQAEQAGYEKYHQAIRDLGSIKGVKKTNISYFSPVDNTQKTNEGFDVGQGVGVVIHKVGNSNEYAVTHINTGLAMGHNWKNRAEAIALAKSVAGITDWSQFSNEKEIPQEIMSKAASLVRGFTQKNLQG